MLDKRASLNDDRFKGKYVLVTLAYYSEVGGGGYHVEGFKMCVSGSWLNFLTKAHWKVTKIVFNKGGPLKIKPAKWTWPIKGVRTY